MGRSENSRNKIFQEAPNGFVRTKTFDESKMTDPSLLAKSISRESEAVEISIINKHNESS